VDRVENEENSWRVATIPSKLVGVTLEIRCMPIDKSILVKSYEQQRKSLWQQFLSPARHHRNGIDTSVEVKGRALVRIAELRALIDDLENGRSQ